MKNLFFIFCLISFARVGVSQNNQRYIEVISEEEMYVEADEVTLSFKPTEPNNYDIESSENNKSFAEREAVIRKHLLAKGITESHIIFTHKNVFKKQGKECTLTIKKVTHIAQLLKELDSIGIVGATIKDIQTSKREHYLDIMAIKALEKAKTKATSMVSTYKSKLGDVLIITETNTGATKNLFKEMMEADPFIEEYRNIKENHDTFTIKLQYKVVVRFEIL